MKLFLLNEAMFKYDKGNRTYWLEDSSQVEYAFV